VPKATRAHVEHFARDLRRRNLSPATISHYRNALERFERQAGRELVKATRDDLRDWLDTLRVAPRTTFWYVSTLRVFYNWAVDEEPLARSPAAGLVTPRYGRLVPRPIGRDDLELALHGARPRMKAWLWPPSPGSGRRRSRDYDARTCSTWSSHRWSSFPHRWAGDSGSCPSTPTSLTRCASPAYRARVGCSCHSAPVVRCNPPP